MIQRTTRTRSQSQHASIRINEVSSVNSKTKTTSSTGQDAARTKRTKTTVPSKSRRLGSSSSSVAATNQRPVSPVVAQSAPPTFTWDIAKVDQCIIYDDLGVQEMDLAVEGATTDGPHQQQQRKKTQVVTSSNAKGEVKGDHLTSPNQVKMVTEHIHNGYSCSCKRQLLLDKGGDPFSRLSDEVMLGLFWWLPMVPLTRSARVCKRWRHLVFDDTLWKKIDLSTKTFGPGDLGRILRCGTVAAKLSRCSVHGQVFDNDGSTSESSRSNDAKSLPTLVKQQTLNLKYLDLSASDTNPQHLLDILESCPGNQIVKLSLESCTVSRDVMGSVSRQGASLEELNLCMTSGIESVGLRTLLDRCTKLKALNLAWTSLSRRELSVLVECAPSSLEKLNLSGCKHSLNNQDIISLAAKRCSSMKELDISDATSIGFPAIDAIVDHMTHLQYLAISRCYAIPLMAIMQLSNLKHLRALDNFGSAQKQSTIESMQEFLPGVKINIYPFSSIARPTTTKKRTSIWEVFCHE